MTKRLNKRIWNENKYKKTKALNVGKGEATVVSIHIGGKER